MKGSTTLGVRSKRAARPSVNGLLLIYGLPISSVNLDFFAANTSELYAMPMRRNSSLLMV